MTLTEIPGLFLQFLAPIASANLGIIHSIPEGHVGVYWRGGALLPTISEPGRSCLVSAPWFGPF
jgi:hypothetical protein